MVHDAGCASAAEVMTDDPIVALATPRAQSAVFLLRISGQVLRRFLWPLCHRHDCQPRIAHLVRLYDDHDDVIDEGLLVFFAGPASYTGEDVIEFSGHGSPVLMSAVLSRCVSLGLRLAAPGEFTRRAFLNGKMDLAQAEAVGDIIQASSLRQAKAALRSLSGALGVHIRAFRERLLSLRVLVEASIDFVEEDLGVTLGDEWRAHIGVLYQDLLSLRCRLVSAARLRDGLSIVFVGEPNVGKSSLLNACAQEDAAIVTPMAGTTRDVIRVSVQHAGLMFHLSDTAGFRPETADMIEQIGWERAIQAMQTADMICWVLDATVESSWDRCRRLFDQYQSLDALHVVVWNKSDLPRASDVPSLSCPAFSLSAKTGQGLDALYAFWRTFFEQRLGSAEDDIYVARTRHLCSIDEVLHVLEQAQEQALPWEMLAECLRLAQSACDDILGLQPSDELLDRIFSEFCVGK